METNEKYILMITDVNGLRMEKTFSTFQELKNHLTHADYFDWILEQEENHELPCFGDIHSVDELQEMLTNEYYKWTQKYMHVKAVTSND